jgi:hypothetical protein
MDIQAMATTGIVQHQTALAAAVVPREQFNAFMARSGGKQAAARARAILDIQVLTVVQILMSVLKELIIVTTTQLAPTHWEASPAPATPDMKTTMILEKAYWAHRVAISTSVTQELTTVVPMELAPTHREASPATATLVTREMAIIAWMLTNVKCQDQTATTVMITQLAQTNLEVTSATATPDIKAMANLVKNQTALAAAVVTREQFNAFMARSEGKQAAARALAILDMKVLTVVQTSMSVQQELTTVIRTRIAPTQREASTANVIPASREMARIARMSTNAVMKTSTIVTAMQLAQTRRVASTATAVWVTREMALRARLVSRERTRCRQGLRPVIRAVLSVISRHRPRQCVITLSKVLFGPALSTSSVLLVTS